MTIVAVTGIVMTGSTAASRAVIGRRGDSPVTWQVAEEVAVAFEYNGRSHAVMMASPADLHDFAVGFSLAEQIIATSDAIDHLTVKHTPLGYVLDIRVDPPLLLQGALRRRSIAGRSGCGLCGVDSLADAVRDPPPVTAGTVMTGAAATRAFAALPGLQPMNAVNRSVHAAAWADRHGGIVLVREDVGRHNALDKLIGALARQGEDLSAGFAVLSSRCSFELVQKAANVGIGGLACLSAPTGLALDLADQAGIVIAAADGTGTVMFGV